MRVSFDAVLDNAWLLVAILPPLVINFWGQQPFELPKAAVLRTLVWLIACLTLVDSLRTGNSLTRRLRANPLVGPIVTLALVIVFTTVTAVDWRLSLWGSYDRAQGAIMLLSYLLLCLLAADRIRWRNQGLRLLAALAVTSLPLILIALLQTAGFGFPGLGSDGSAPIFATLGRSNFLGAYLAILLPLTLMLALISRHRAGRIAWVVLCFMQLVVLGLTVARSAWIAAAVSLLLMALLWLWPTVQPRVRRVVRSGLIPAILLTPATLLWLSGHASGSVAARLTIWRASLKLIAQRPLLGYGADSLGIVFPRVFPPELVYYQGRDVYVDRAHNVLLDWAIMAGLPGLLAFLFLVFTFFVVVIGGLRRSRSREQRAVLIAVVAAVTGVLVNNLFSFDVTATAMAFWLLVGMGVGIAGWPAAPENDQVCKRRARLWLLGGPAVIGLIAIVWTINVRPVQADIAARTAVRLVGSSESDAAITAAERAIVYWPVEPAHLLLLGKLHQVQSLGGSPDAAGHLAHAEDALLAARRVRPEDAAIWMQNAVFYVAVASRTGGEMNTASNAAYQQAMLRAPNQANYYLVWAYSQLAMGNRHNAVLALRQSVALDATNGEAFLLLGETELALENVDEALSAFGEALRLMPDSDVARQGMVRANHMRETSRFPDGRIESRMRQDYRESN